MSFITLLLALVASASAAPAMVTATQGGVKVGAEVAPAAPFLFDAGQTLHVADGASVVLLYEGAARQLSGPMKLSLGELEGASAARGDAVAALDELLERKSSTARAGAVRASASNLLRPLPNKEIIALQTIAWSCPAGCDALTVEVVDFMADEVVWSGTGQNSLIYDGPALAAGRYTIRSPLGESAFKVLGGDDAAKVEQAREAARKAALGLEGDAAMKLSIEAGVLVQIGLPTEALYLLDRAVAENPDDAALKAMHADWDARLR